MSSVPEVAPVGVATNLRTRITFAAVGAVAMVLADMVHEAVGHGTACLLTGNRILSLSTVAIQTAEASRFVSAAGTIVNLIVGSLALLLFARLKQLTPTACFWWLFGVFNLANSGYLVASAVFNSSDWANVIAGFSPPWLLRCALGLVGAALCVLSVAWAARLMVRRVESGQLGLPDVPNLTRPAYIAAGAVMTCASFFNPIGPALILPSGVAASFGLNAGLLFIPGIVADHARTHSSITTPIGLSFVWIALALVTGGLFVAVLGPGLRFSN
jgi:hypothetical protein